MFIFYTWSWSLSRCTKSTIYRLGTGGGGPAAGRPGSAGGGPIGGRPTGGGGPGGGGRLGGPPCAREGSGGRGRAGIGREETDWLLLAAAPAKSSLFVGVDRPLLWLPPEN